MSRLRYSPQGFMRSLQVARVTLHAFVEGRDVDPFFYGAILESQCAGIPYKVTRADELPGFSGSGGKQALLALFESLRRARRLVSEFKGHTSAVIFFLDKDVDDIRRATKRSAHIVYTHEYDVEGAVIRNSDLPRAIAVTLMIDPQSVLTVMPATDLRASAAEEWREWTALCLGAQLTQASCTNYGSPSLINPVPGMAHDPVLAADYERKIINSCSLPTSVAATRLERARRLVDSAYSSGDHDRVFRGKWYRWKIKEFVNAQWPDELARTAGFADRLMGHACQTLDHSAGWATPYRTGIRTVLALTN